MAAAETATTARTLVTGARIAGSIGRVMNDDRDLGGTGNAARGGERPEPVAVMDLGDGYFDVTMSDGKRYRMTAEQLDAAYRAW